METLSVDRLTLYFEHNDRETAELVREACERSIHIVHQTWELALPEDCRVYVLTSSWLRSIFHAAPLGWQVVLGITLPLWYFRTKRTWQVAAGWAQPFGKRRFIGVKPARLIQLSDRSMGSRIFIQTDDLKDKVRHTTCHELTHACAAHLKLPIWLNEGLAMFTVDQYVGKPTVQEDTLEFLHHPSAEPAKTNYRKLNIKDQEAVIYLYARGYWITRYLEETHPGTLKRLFVQRFNQHELETKIASACGLTRDEFWRLIDGMITAHFRD
jgi:hypothetical protein